MGVPQTDHLGHRFSSVREMCDAWGVSAAVYRRRRARGWSLRDALVTRVVPAGSKASRPCRDHEGTEYPSVAAMCRRWHVSTATYQNRLARGWTVEDALTVPARSVHAGAVPCVDHEGTEYPSKAAMLRRWGVSKQAFYRRLRKGKTLEQALTGSGLS